MQLVEKNSANLEGPIITLQEVQPSKEMSLSGSTDSTVNNEPLELPENVVSLTRDELGVPKKGLGALLADIYDTQT
jgi:hypothetical protein